MKKKPMLMNKVLKYKRKSGREVIGLIGAHPGAGVTYTALLLAFYMGEELGRRTAFLECNKNQDLGLLQTSFEWEQEAISSFSFGAITFFKEVAGHRITELLNDSYDCFILDFGSDFVNTKEEFLRCGTKIMIGSRAEWNRQKFIRFLTSLQGIRGNEAWLPLIPCADKSLLNSMKKELGRVFYAVPFEKDPRSLSKDTVKLFRMLLG